MKIARRSSLAFLLLALCGISPPVLLPGSNVNSTLQGGSACITGAEICEEWDGTAGFTMPTGWTQVDGTSNLWTTEAELDGSGIWLQSNETTVNYMKNRTVYTSSAISSDAHWMAALMTQLPNGANAGTPYFSPLAAGTGSTDAWAILYFSAGDDQAHFGTFNSELSYAGDLHSFGNFMTGAGLTSDQCDAAIVAYEFEVTTGDNYDLAVWVFNGDDFTEIPDRPWPTSDAAANGDCEGAGNPYACCTAVDTGPCDLFYDSVTGDAGASWFDSGTSYGTVAGNNPGNTGDCRRAKIDLFSAGAQ